MNQVPLQIYRLGSSEDYMMACMYIESVKEDHNIVLSIYFLAAAPNLTIPELDQLPPPPASHE